MTETLTDAAEFARVVKQGGWTVEFWRESAYSAIGCTVEKRFPAGDGNAYASAETEANYLLSFLPMMYPGTVWGTDGRSVGGHAGLTGGYMRLSKSGCGARVAKALAKACGVQVRTRREW
jgi:hypothetical protein